MVGKSEKTLKNGKQTRYSANGAGFVGAVARIRAKTTRKRAQTLRCLAQAFDVWRSCILLPLKKEKRREGGRFSWFVFVYAGAVRVVLRVGA